MLEDLKKKRIIRIKKTILGGENHETDQYYE